MFFCWLKGGLFVLLCITILKPQNSLDGKKNAPLYIHGKKNIKIPSRKQGKKHSQTNHTEGDRILEKYGGNIQAS